MKAESCDTGQRRADLDVVRLPAASAGATPPELSWGLVRRRMAMGREVVIMGATGRGLHARVAA